MDERVHFTAGRSLPTATSGKTDVSNQWPFVSCLCPTYRRPRLLANSLACFLAQDYPPEFRELVILDDAGSFCSQVTSGWELLSIPRRFRSLPEKYNALAGLARGDVLAIWEDDDVYLPWHISAHVGALARGGLSKPSRVICDYSGEYREEDAGAVFHASIAFRREALEAVGGWPVTQRNDFDQQLIAALGRVTDRADPCENHPPSYVHRGATTGAYHGQALMREDDDGWYARAEGAGADGTNLELAPCFDKETWHILKNRAREPRPREGRNENPLH